MVQGLDSATLETSGQGGGGPEVVSPKARGPAVANCIAELRDSFRFEQASGIGRVSRCIRAGDGGGVLAGLRDVAAADVTWVSVPAPRELAEALRPIIIRGFTEYLQAPTVRQKFTAFERFRILCALRRGPFGVEAVNALVERILVEERLISPGSWYCGRPLMITQNDYNLKLFNGDIGIVLPEDYPLAASPSGTGEISSPTATPENPANGWPSAGVERGSAYPERDLRVFFPAIGDAPRKFLPARLPPHETVYSMTVHKSQGSEFDEVLLLLPGQDSPVLSRELIYTGVTRARRKVALWGREDVLLAAVGRRVQRSSGLRDALWGA